MDDLKSECDAVDALLRHLGQNPERFRSEGGAINGSRLRAWLASRDDTAGEEDRQGGQPSIWRCFHCDLVLVDRHAAREHFGTSEVQTPGCAISIEHVRWLEAQHRRNVDEDTEVLRAIRGLAGEHEVLRRRAEELGYARGLEDAKKHPAELGLMAIPGSVA